MNTTQLTLNLPMIVTYGLLMLSITMLWMPTIHYISNKIKLWTIIFSLSLASALFWEFLHFISLFPILIFAAACYLTTQTKKSKKIKVIGGTVVTFLAIGFAAHLVPGFSNPKLISNIVNRADAIAYTQHLNFDKALVGLFILAFGHHLLSTKREWLDMLKTTLPLTVMLIVVMMFLSVFMGYIQFDLKLTYLFFLWALPNLFFTCIAEEAFFRAFVQKHLVESLKTFKYGSIAGLLLTSLLFGFAHYPGGSGYIVLASVAGLGYGWIYQRTKSIEASIFAHFLLNTVHLVFFTYPALANA